MPVHGRPYWGAKIEAGAIGPMPIQEYELDGELKIVDWTWICIDNAPGYISPQLTFCGEPMFFFPPLSRAPFVPIRVYYSHTGNGSDWQLVDPADYMDGVYCVDVPSVLWPPMIIALNIFDFLDADKYFPGGSPTLGEIVYLMWTENDPKWAARRGLSPKVIGVTPV